MAESRPGWVRTCGQVLLVVAAGLVFWRVREVVVTILMALVMAYILRPMVDQFCALKWHWRGRERHLPRVTATGLVFVFLALVVWAVWVVSAEAIRRQVQEFRVEWPAYQVAIQRQVENIEALRRDLPEPVRQSVDAWAAGLVGMVSAGLQKGLRAGLANIKMLVELILVPIIAFYILSDGRSIRQQVLFFVPRRYLAWTDHALARSDDAFQRFIRGQVILCLIAFAVVTIGLRAINLDFYLLLGVIAGLTRAIPIIGPLFGAIPILVVVLLTKDFAFTVWVLLAFTVMHLLESKLLMPAVLGRELKLHPVLIIVALLVGAQVSGLLGMFLAAPVLAVIRTLIAEQRQKTRPSEVDSTPVAEPEAVA